MWRKLYNEKVKTGVIGNISTYVEKTDMPNFVTPYN